MKAIALSLLIFITLLPAARLRGQDAPPKIPFRVVVWNCRAASLDDFEAAAKSARDLGATHLVVTNDLPRAKWEYDTPGDPYPAWYVNRPGVLKVFPPPAMQSYVPGDYAKQISDIVAGRCAILARYGLKGVWIANEPQVLPEAAFADHPLWRGPRVDQPNRSRVARFAPAADEPQVLDLYRQSLALLVKRCPQIDLMQFLTTDSGSGLDWAASLYPGINGPARFKSRPIADQLHDFLSALQQGAQDGGGRIEIRMYQVNPEEWMAPTFADPQALARLMPAGVAIDNYESPSASPFIASAGNTEPSGFFYPVPGIPRAVETIASLRTAWTSRAPRLNFGVAMDCDALYAHLFAGFAAHPAATLAGQYRLLHDLAATEVGSANADDLLDVWQAIAGAGEIGATLRWCYPFDLGGVHQRWITRPLVPFPAELPAAQRDYWRNFLLEARSEEQADDLVDNQAMELFKGWPGRMWITNTFNAIDPQIRAARQKLTQLIPHLPADKLAEYQLLDLRLQMVQCLATNARDAVNYQAVLDYLKEKAAKTESDPPLGTAPSWDRQMIMQIARDEIDNSAAMIELLKKTARPLLDCAKRADDEDIRLLGPNVADQLKIKIDCMNAHWEDYKRLTTTPNP